MKTSISLFCLLLCASPAAAQQNELPIEISAAHSLEWDRTAKTYTARDNVIAKKGTTTLQSQTLIARYVDASQSTDISQLTATGNVTLTSPPYHIYGDHAVYNVKTGHAILTGQGLKITTENAQLTAQDKIEYNAQTKTMTATGKAVAVNEGQTLRADTLTMHFMLDTHGKMTTKKINATGNISIHTDKEKIYGEQGSYNLTTQTAILTGNVRIYQGSSLLQGSRATVDMNTGISQLFADDNIATEGRVKGVFYPKKKKQE